MSIKKQEVEDIWLVLSNISIDTQGKQRERQTDRDGAERASDLQSVQGLKLRHMIS